jgi:hypothetical protein
MNIEAEIKRIVRLATSKRNAKRRARKTRQSSGAPRAATQPRQPAPTKRRKQ